MNQSPEPLPTALLREASRPALPREQRRAWSTRIRLAAGQAESVVPIEDYIADAVALDAHHPLAAILERAAA